jgi:hypothetical protein
MGHDDFWASLTGNSSSQLLTAAMDSHLSGKSIGESFEGVRALTDMGRAARALALPVEAGTRVAFMDNVGAVLTYENPPEPGSMGTVVHVKSAGGNVTSHEGKVFVSWDDKRFLPVHAEHLVRVAAGKTAAPNQAAIQAALLGYVKDLPPGTRMELSDVVRHPSFRGMHFGKVESAAKALAKSGVVRWDGSTVTKTAGIVGFDFFDMDDDAPHAPNPEHTALRAFEREAGGAAQMGDIQDVVRSIPPGVVKYHYVPRTTSHPNPMWFVWGDVDKAGAARLARALFKGRIPPTKRHYSAPGVFSSVLYIGLSDGTLAKFVAPEGLGGKTAFVRVASLGDLTSFFTKVGGDTLIHKSTRDLWALKQDAGGYLIERLFDDQGEPLKG